MQEPNPASGPRPPTLRDAISRLGAAALRITPASTSRPSCARWSTQPARSPALAAGSSPRRRGGQAAGVRLLRPDRRRGAAHGGVARRHAAVRPPARPRRAAAPTGPRRLREGPRPRPGADPLLDVLRHAAAPRRGRRGQLLPRREGGSAPFDRRDEELLVLFAAQAAIALANGGAPRRAPRPGRPRGAGGDGPGRRRGDRRRLRGAARHQPRGAAHRGGAVPAGRPAEDLPGVLTSRLADGREMASATSAARGPCAPRRWSYPCPTGAACAFWSTSRPSGIRRTRSSG